MPLLLRLQKIQRKDDREWEKMSGARRSCSRSCGKAKDAVGATRSCSVGKQRTPLEQDVLVLVGR